MISFANSTKITFRNRQRRALAGLTRQGVPIMEESYLERRNRTSNEYLDPLLTSNNVNRPRMKLDWNDSRYGLLMWFLPFNTHSKLTLRFSSQTHHRRYQQHETQHHSAPPAHHRQPVFKNDPITRSDNKIVLTDRNGAPRGYAQVIKKRAQVQSSKTNGYYYRRVVIWWVLVVCPRALCPVLILVEKCCTVLSIL